MEEESKTSRRLILLVIEGYRLAHTFPSLALKISSTNHIPDTVDFPIWDIVSTTIAEK